MLVALVLAALTLGDRSPATDRVGTAASPVAMPVAARADALGSTFFCAGGTATADGAFDLTVVIANPGTVPVRVTVTAYPGAFDTAEALAALSGLAPVSRQYTIKPRSRGEVRVGEIQASPFAAALVEAVGGPVAVEHRVVGPRGTDSGPCPSAASPTWFFPDGTTTVDAHEYLSLFNPFPGDATVDLTFTTSEGFRSPQALQNYLVPGGSVRVVDVGTLLKRHEVVSATVEASGGQLVVARLQDFDGTDSAHPGGLAVTAGAPRPQPVWMFAEGQKGEGVREIYTVYNPGQEPARAQLEVALDNPEVNGIVDPIPVEVAPRAFARVAMHDESRVPPGVGHAVVVRTLNGVPVVAERAIASDEPADKVGYAPALGVPLVARTWLFADGRADATVAEFVSVLNPSPDRAVRVSFTALAQGQDLAIDGLRDVEVRPGGRIVVDLGAHVNRADLPLVVDADGPVAAERGLYRADRAGIALAAGIPLPEGTEEPQLGPPELAELPEPPEPAFTEPAPVDPASPSPAAPSSPGPASPPPPSTPPPSSSAAPPAASSPPPTTAPAPTGN